MFTLYIYIYIYIYIYKIDPYPIHTSVKTCHSNTKLVHIFEEKEKSFIWIKSHTHIIFSFLNKKKKTNFVIIYKLKLTWNYNIIFTGFVIVSIEIYKDPSTRIQKKIIYIIILIYMYRSFNEKIYLLQWNLYFF